MGGRRYSGYGEHVRTVCVLLRAPYKGEQNTKIMRPRQGGAERKAARGGCTMRIGRTIYYTVVPPKVHRERPHARSEDMQAQGEQEENLNVWRRHGGRG